MARRPKLGQPRLGFELGTLMSCEARHSFKLVEKARGFSETAQARIDQGQSHFLNAGPEGLWSGGQWLDDVNEVVLRYVTGQCFQIWVG